MAELFVSYCSRDRPRVAEISGALETNGYSLWWDRRLAGGADYGMEIEREIEAARCVLVAWSAAARDSLWVRAEANAALEQDKLLQLSLDEAKLPLPFTMLHALDFSGWRGEREGAPWSELEAGIAARTGGERRAPALRAEALPGGKLQGLSGVVAMGWGAIALAAVTALAVIGAATGAVAPGIFAGFSLIALALAALLLGGTALVTARKLAASR